MKRPIALISAALVVTGVCAKARVDELPEKDDQPTGGFTSSAKILVQYVVDQPGDAPGKKAPDGATVLKAEMAKLKNAALLRRVAKAIGPEKILGPTGSARGTDAKAAAAIQKGLQVSNRKNSNVISIYFRHADPTIAQEVLKQMIEERWEDALKKHRHPPFEPDPALPNLTVIQQPSKPRAVSVGRAACPLHKNGEPEAKQRGKNQAAPAGESK